MAFSAVPISRELNIIGDRKVVVGRWSNDGGSTGGDIDTGLRICENLRLQVVGPAATSNIAVVHSATAFPIAGNKITIITILNTAGLYEAYGY